jgi:hypothetical protein
MINPETQFLPNAKSGNTRSEPFRLDTILIKGKQPFAPTGLVKFTNAIAFCWDKL